MAGKYRKFTPEFRDEAARMVVETSRPIADVARELGINETSLGNWVRAYREEHAGDEPPLQLPERARLRELERENRELRMKNDFLSKAAAYFAAEHRLARCMSSSMWSTPPAGPRVLEVVHHARPGRQPPHGPPAGNPEGRGLRHRDGTA